jgi:hypothetical protein
MQDEIKSFEEVGFVLNKQQPIFFQNLFGKESSILINRPVDEMLRPTTPSGKAIRWIMMSNLYYNRWEADQFLEASINTPLEVPLLGYG